MIVNAAECEPLITVDQVLLLNKADRLIAILEEVRQDLGAKEAVIAIKAKHQMAIQEVDKAIAPIPK